MNRITKYTLLVIMVLMVLPSQSNAGPLRTRPPKSNRGTPDQAATSNTRLRTPQARARALQLSQLIAMKAHNLYPVQRVVKFTKRCTSGICRHNR